MPRTEEQEKIPKIIDRLLKLEERLRRRSKSQTGLSWNLRHLE